MVLSVAHVHTRMTTNGSPKSFIALHTGYLVYKPCILVPRAYSQLNFQYCLLKMLKILLGEGVHGYKHCDPPVSLINTEL